MARSWLFPGCSCCAGLLQQQYLRPVVNGQHHLIAPRLLQRLQQGPSAGSECRQHAPLCIMHTGFGNASRCRSMLRWLAGSQRLEPGWEGLPASCAHLDLVADHGLVPKVLQHRGAETSMQGVGSPGQHPTATAERAHTQSSAAVAATTLRARPKGQAGAPTTMGFGTVSVRGLSLAWVANGAGALTRCRTGAHFLPLCALTRTAPRVLCVNVNTTGTQQG